jgi:hypothetical protein
MSQWENSLREIIYEFFTILERDQLLGKIEPIHEAYLFAFK